MWGGPNCPATGQHNYTFIMKKSTTQQKTIINHRDAGTGQFVTKRYTETHPKTTVTERNKVPTKRR